MAKIITLTDREPRGQTAIACAVLQTPKGLTAAELAEKTGQTTYHNSWSLRRVADRFGFKFVPIDGSKTSDGLKRYRFDVPAKKAASNSNKKPAAKKMTNAGKKPAAKNAA